MLALNLPRSYAKEAEGHSLHEIGNHPWAGMKVELTTFPIGTDSEGTEAVGFGFRPVEAN